MAKVLQIKFLLLIATTAFFLSAMPGFANAATLFFSPSSGSYAVGGSLSVNINVSSTGQAMNATSGIVSFPQDKLEVVSISKTGSVCNLWVQEPSFSNNYGTARFECVVLNPGFTGSLGRIMTINFNSKAAGLAVLNFSSSSVLANDGNGTDILTGTGSANLSLGKIKDVVPPQDTSSKTNGMPLAPQISSPTHPDQLKWYSLNKAEFNWQLPEDAIATRLLFDHLATTTPTISYVPPINFKEISDISDGIYYFHAQIKNDKGWGQISHFKFQIDTQKPEYLNVNEIRRQDATDPKVRFNFNSNDSLSGIGHYEISIDDTNIQIWQDDGTHIFQTPPIDPGNHTLSVKAIDRAGNFLASSTDFSVSALGQVIITSYPKELNIGDTLIVKTKGSADTKIILSLQKGREEIIQYTAQSDKEGIAVFSIDDELKEGSYRAWVLATDNRGAKSNPSGKVEIKIKQPVFLKIGSFAISFLSLLIPLVALLFILAMMIWYMWHRFSLMRKHLRKEVGEAGSALHKQFDLLKENMRENINLLEKTKNKRELTHEEEKMLKKFTQDLSNAEKLVMKEIKDIEKEIK